MRRGIMTSSFVINSLFEEGIIFKYVYTFSNEMKAITRNKYGSQEVLEVKDIDKPTPKASEVLVRVHATTVNRTDEGVLTGKPLLFRLFIGVFKPKHKVPGTDFAGIVEEVGSEVTEFKVGDRVRGLNDEGLQSQAEYLTIRADKGIVSIPEGFSYEEAVACIEGFHYANNIRKKVVLSKDIKVLLNGATGAIGSAALQILKSEGCYVTAVCNTKNIALVKSLGADKIYNFETEDFTFDTEKYDFILDAVGKSRFALTKHLMKEEGGIYISTELGNHAENVYLPLLTYFSKRQVKFPIPVNVKKSLLSSNDLMSSGQFVAVIDRTYKMSDIKEAYRYVMSGQKTGNVILQIE